MPDPDEIRTTLRDGTPVLLRPVRPGDKDRFIEGLKLMSMESRYLRFFAPVLEFTAKQLEFLTEVDQEMHVAWGALDPDLPEFPGFGVARYVRLDEDPAVAEVAVAVIDEMHRQGLGSLLLALLYLIGCRKGLKTFRGTIAPANRFLIEWARGLEAEVRYADGLYRVEVPLIERVADFPETEEGRKFGAVVEQLGVLFPA
jgi:GNAT superfamily N-acetyltransferase